MSGRSDHWPGRPPADPTAGRFDRWLSVYTCSVRPPRDNGTCTSPGTVCPSLCERNESQSCGKKPTTHSAPAQDSRLFPNSPHAAIPHGACETSEVKELCCQGFGPETMPDKNPTPTTRQPPPKPSAETWQPNTEHRNPGPKLRTPHRSSNTYVQNCTTQPRSSHLQNTRVKGQTPVPKLQNQIPKRETHNP